VVRDLLRPDALTPLAAIADFNRYPQFLRFTPDGASLLAEGLGGTGDRRVRVFRMYEAVTGRFLWDIPTQLPPDTFGGSFSLDPTGRYLWADLERGSNPTLLDLATRTSLGRQDTPMIALAPKARRWLSPMHRPGGAGDAYVLFERGRSDELIAFPLEGDEGGFPIFTPDGCSVCWSGPGGSVRVLNLPEIQRRLAALGLGW
jgi:hypothetical protein